MKTYWVYMLRCRDDSYYVGMTSNLEQRLEQHERGYFVTCYTYRRRPLHLVHAESFGTPDEAIFAESVSRNGRARRKMRSYAKIGRKFAALRDRSLAITLRQAQGDSVAGGDFAGHDRLLAITLRRGSG